MSEISKYHNYSLKDLCGVQQVVKSNIAAQNAIGKEVQSEIDRRLGGRLSEVLKAQKKDTGTASINLEDGGTAKRSVKKDVKYDPEKMMGIVSRMPWSQAKDLFKFEITLPEKNYPGLAASPELKKAVDEARTVTPKPEKIELTYPDPA